MHIGIIKWNLLPKVKEKLNHDLPWIMTNGHPICWQTVQYPRNSVKLDTLLFMQTKQSSQSKKILDQIFRSSSGIADFRKCRNLHIVLVDQNT
jgi:hypothetical protein